MTLIRRFFSGPSLMQAVLAAARHHDVDPDDLVYEVIDKKHGFLKTPRGVVIEVDPEHPARDAAPAPASGPAPETAPPEPAPEPASEATPEAAPEQDVATPGEPADRLAAMTDPVSPGAPVFQAPAAPAVESEPSAEPPAAAAERPWARAEPLPRDRTTSGSRPAESAPSEDGASESRSGEAPAVESLSAEAPFAEAPSPAAPAPAEAAPAARDEDSPVEAARSDRKWFDGAATGTEEEVAQPAGSAAATPSAPAVALEPEFRDAVAQAVDELVFLASLRVQVATVTALEDGLAVELEGPDSERVVAHGGRALLAIQHLLPRLLFSTLGRATHCRLDCEGFHASRAERLAGLALKAAERVRSGGRSWLLEPMAPDERRLVHLALADEADVETKSVGEGYLKRVRVAQV